MSLRQKHKVWVNTSRNTAMTDLVYGPEENDRLVQNDAFDQWGGGSIKIAVSDNEDLDLVDVENVKGIYREKRDLMLSALDEYMPDLPGLSWTRPEGGLFLWVRLPDGFDAEQLFYEALEQNVAFVVGTAFHCDGGGQNAMRLNFSYPTKENIVEGIERLGKVIANHKAASKGGADVLISP